MVLAVGVHRTGGPLVYVVLIILFFLIILLLMIILIRLSRLSRRSRFQGYQDERLLSRVADGCPESPKTPARAFNGIRYRYLNKRIGIRGAVSLLSPERIAADV